MKKIIIAALSVSLLALNVTPVQAAPASTVVIIDSYFDMSKISGNAVKECLIPSECSTVVNYKYNSLTDPIIHGTAMANVAIKQNPNVKLILLQASSVTAKSISLLGGGEFLAALKWVDSKVPSGTAVSFSYNLTGNSACSLSTKGTIRVNVRQADAEIRANIAKLKSKNVPVFVSTGNDYNRKPVNYPACITDTVSVSTAIGGLSLGIGAMGNYDANTDYFGNLPSSKFGYQTAGLGVIPISSSSANIAVAVNWDSGKTYTNKMVDVLP